MYVTMLDLSITNPPPSPPSGGQLDIWAQQNSIRVSTPHQRSPAPLLEIKREREGDVSLLENSCEGTIFMVAQRQAAI